MENEETATAEEQTFHNTVRENIIFLLLFLVLMLISWLIVRRYHKKSEQIEDNDEATVYRISLWLCTFSLAIATGAVLLLPMSIVSNEVLLKYPNSYYVQWLNSSLIKGLWNHIFLFSNLSLFVLLPFAHLFTESEGFAGHKKGIWSRIYEAISVLMLFAVVILGMVYIISAFFEQDRSSLHRLFHLWSYYLPFIYSCVSFLGVLFLLVCTPLGLVHLFSISSQFLVKPQFLRDLNEEYLISKLEEECLRRQIFTSPNNSCASSFLSVSNMSLNSTILPNSPDDNGLRNGALKASLHQRLEAATAKTRLLEKQRRGWSLQRNFLYPAFMLLLLTLTFLTIIMVLQNALQLLVGLKELPLSGTKEITLGEASLSKFGLFGAILELILIVYLVATSAVGLYTLPGFSNIKPKPSATPLSHIILLCGILLLLSSALPLLSRILGITNLDLLGEFGQIEWLGSMLVVLSYNLLFVFSVSACISTKFTATVRQELFTRLKGFGLSLFSNEPILNTWPNSPQQITITPIKKEH